MTETTDDPQHQHPSGTPADAGTGPDENELDPAKTTADDSGDGERSDAG